MAKGLHCLQLAQKGVSPTVIPRGALEFLDGPELSCRKLDNLTDHAKGASSKLVVSVELDIPPSRDTGRGISASQDTTGGLKVRLVAASGREEDTWDMEGCGTLRHCILYLGRCRNSPDKLETSTLAENDSHLQVAPRDHPDSRRALKGVLRLVLGRDIIHLDFRQARCHIPEDELARRRVVEEEVGATIVVRVPRRTGSGARQLDVVARVASEGRDSTRSEGRSVPKREHATSVVAIVKGRVAALADLVSLGTQRSEREEGHGRRQSTAAVVAGEAEESSP